MTNIYVGNLSYETSSQDLENAFADFGQVVKATVVSDRDTGRSKGFGFVEMANASDAQKAIEGMNDINLQGRNLKVNEARPREQRSRSW